MEARRMKRPKSSPSVRWKCTEKSSSSSSTSSFLSTSSSIMNKTHKSMVGNEVKIPSHGSKSPRNCPSCYWNLSCRSNPMFLYYYLFVLAMVPLPSSFLSATSISSSVNHFAADRFVKPSRDLMMDQGSSEPVIGPDLIRVYAILGQNVTVNCSLDDTSEIGSEPNALTKESDIDGLWNRESKKLLPSSKFKVDSRGNLLIENVTIEEEDVYNCIKSNVTGFSGKRSQLHVHYGPKLKGNNKELPQTLAKPTAQTVRLECDIDARPKANIKWFQNGKEVETNGRITLRKSNSSLVISQTVTSDSGLYTCRASNDAANNVSFLIANLTIQASDDSPQKPKGVQVLAVTSNTVSLTWKAPPVANEEFPIVSYSVHFTPDTTASGAPAKEDQRIIMTNSILVERLVPSTNYSFYIRAYNKKGASEPSRTFRVQTKSVDEQQFPASTTTSPPPVPSSPPLRVAPTVVQPPSGFWIPVSITGFKPESPTAVLVSWQKFPTPTSAATNLDTSRTPTTSQEKLKITSFEVHYRKHSHTNYQYMTIDDTDATSALVEALQPGVKYDIRVVATLSSTSAPIHSPIPNQRPPTESPSFGRWSPFEMPSRDSASVDNNNLPPTYSKEINNNKLLNVSHHLHGIQTSTHSNSSNNIFTGSINPFSITTTTQVPDSPFNGKTNKPGSSNGSVNSHFLNSDSEEKEDNLILGIALEKLVVWLTVSLLVFVVLIAAFIILCCCKRGFFTGGCSDGSPSEGRTYANGHLPSMYGDTNGRESREMQLFIDRVGDPDHDTKGRSPESRPLTTKINGSNHAKTKIKTNGSLLNGHKYHSKSETPGKVDPNATSWSSKGCDGVL